MYSSAIPSLLFLYVYFVFLGREGGYPYYVGVTASSLLVLSSVFYVNTEN